MVGTISCSSVTYILSEVSRLVELIDKRRRITYLSSDPEVLVNPQPKNFDAAVIFIPSCRVQLAWRLGFFDQIWDGFNPWLPKEVSSSKDYQRPIPS